MERAIVIFSGIRENYTSITGKAFEDATMLDYGAGWGRITRLALHTCKPENVHACDADPKSVDLFNSLNFPMECKKVSVMPDHLPYEENTFDLIWLWSILTHLPEKNADAVMKALSSIIKLDGILVVTIRPAAFWTNNPLTKKKQLAETHEKYGFAHESQGAHWGNTSMSLEYIEQKWPQWSLVRTAHNETHQVSVFLRRNS
jgi:2-polyprenyl-3-methyl-5-hydroxy-6-metoxy-1,4-benzoquinol methylase